MWTPYEESNLDPNVRSIQFYSLNYRELFAGRECKNQTYLVRFKAGCVLRSPIPYNKSEYIFLRLIFCQILCNVCSMYSLETKQNSFIQALAGKIGIEPINP